MARQSYLQTVFFYSISWSNQLHSQTIYFFGGGGGLLKAVGGKWKRYSRTPAGRKLMESIEGLKEGVLCIRESLEFD